MRFRLLSSVNRDAVGIARHYADIDPALGADFLNKLDDACEIVEREYLGYPRWEAIETSRDVRRIILKRFPYLLIYEVLPDEVVGIAVRHVRQDPGTDLPE